MMLRSSLGAPSEEMPVLPPGLRLYSVRQVGRILQVTEASVRKLIFSGELRAKRVGILVRVPEPELERYLERSDCTRPDARRDPRRRAEGRFAPAAI